MIVEQGISVNILTHIIWYTDLVMSSHLINDLSFHFIGPVECNQMRFSKSNNATENEADLLFANLGLSMNTHVSDFCILAGARHARRQQGF